MRVYTQEVFIPNKEIELKNIENIQQYCNSFLSKKLPNPHRIIRFVITKSNQKGLYCELDLLVSEKEDKIKPYLEKKNPVFNFRKRTYENNNKFNAVHARRRYNQYIY